MFQSYSKPKVGRFWDNKGIILGEVPQFSDEVGREKAIFFGQKIENVSETVRYRSKFINLYVQVLSSNRLLVVAECEVSMMST